MFGRPTSMLIPAKVVSLRIAKTGPPPVDWNSYIGLAGFKLSKMLLPRRLVLKIIKGAHSLSHWFSQDCNELRILSHVFLPSPWVEHGMACKYLVLVCRTSI